MINGKRALVFPTVSKKIQALFKFTIELFSTENCNIEKVFPHH